MSRTPELPHPQLFRLQRIFLALDLRRGILVPLLLGCLCEELLRVTRCLRKALTQLDHSAFHRFELHVDLLEALLGLHSSDPVDNHTETCVALKRLRIIDR